MRPDDTRGELSAILAEATGKARELAAEETEADRKRIGEAGVAIILGLTSDEREAWRNATADVEKRFAGEVGEALLAQVRAVLAR